MTRDEIIKHPDKVGLIETLLKRLQTCTNEMYAAKRELDNVQNGTNSTEAKKLKEDLIRAIEQLERAGLFGEEMFYCDKCKRRVAAVEGVYIMTPQWKCKECGEKVIKISDLDPVKVRESNLKLEKDLKLTNASLKVSDKQKEALMSENAKLREEIWELEQNAVFLQKNAPDPTHSVRAKRSIRL
jgi:hypothetical protein